MATEQLTSSVADMHVSGSARLRPAYGFDDVALVPGALTIDPDDVDISWQLGPHRFAASRPGLGDGRRGRSRRSPSPWAGWAAWRC